MSLSLLEYVKIRACFQVIEYAEYDDTRSAIGNESEPKIIINGTLIFFLKVQSAFW